MRRALAYRCVGILLTAMVAPVRADVPADPAPTIDLATHYLGVFSTHGTFKDFQIDVALDATGRRPAHVGIVVEARSVEADWSDATPILKSKEFFDVDKFPTIEFNSVAVRPLSASRAAIAGNLTMRGSTHPLLIETELTDRHVDPHTRSEVADLILTGELNRRDYGMKDYWPLVSDVISFRITKTVEIGQ